MRSHSTQTTYTFGGKHLTKVVGSGTNRCIVKYQTLSPCARVWPARLDYTVLLPLLAIKEAAHVGDKNAKRLARGVYDLG